MSDGNQTPVVIYAAKSTEDRHGSIPTQLSDCRDYAERHGWHVVGEFEDEGFSAYKGNRGPGLAAAKQAATDAAVSTGQCVLLAQDADRFARGAGDGPGAADHLGELFFAMRRAGVELWSVRNGHLDLLRATLEGERSNSESARKRQSVRAGLARRKERGQPVGRMPYGYSVLHEVINGEPVATRQPDADMAPVVRRAFELAEHGMTDGEIARQLNGEGITTQHDKPFRRQTIQMMLERDHYCGERGYPAIVERDQWERVNAMRLRRDPVKRQVRRGGRPTSQRFLLRQLVHCERCGVVLGRLSRRGKRMYQCRRAMDSIGVCDAPAVPADVLETAILNHLGSFVGSTRDLLAKQLEVRDDLVARDVAAITELERKRLGLERTRGRVMDDYRRLMSEGSGASHVALEDAARIDRELTDLDGLIEAARARADANRETPDVDGALELYSRLGELVNDALADTMGDVEATNRTLRSVLSGLWGEHDRERHRLLVRFALLVDASERYWLPPVNTDYFPLEPLATAPTGLPAITPC
jgi:DNA invertase Pin-like site-specific DNA recombinase